MRTCTRSWIVALALGGTVAVAAPSTAQAQSHDDLIAQAVLPLPEDLRADASVFRYDDATGERELLREGSNHVECSPRAESGFTLCYPKSTAAWRDMRTTLNAEGLSQDEIEQKVSEAEAAGTVKAPSVGSMVYRLYDEGDRIQLLWLILVPNQTAADLAMPMGSQRDNSLAGHGTPWLMNEGTQGAHLMMPINQTDLSNAGMPEVPLDPSTVTDPDEQATLPLPDDLKGKATVSTFDAETGLWTLHQRGSTTIECRPHDPESGFTRCYHESVWAARDMSARLAAQGHSEDEISEAMDEARADGTLEPTAMASLGYRLYGADDRIRLLWILRVPGATAAELGMPTGSQRDSSLAGRGTPWMMNEGTASAHLMIPINGTALSNR